MWTDQKTVASPGAYVLADYPLNEICHWANQKPCGFPTKNISAFGRRVAPGYHLLGTRVRATWVAKPLDAM